MNRTLSVTAVCLAVACCAPSAHAASITPAAFVTPIVDDFTGLGLPTTNAGPLVRPEGTFTFTPTTFRYLNMGGTPFFGEAIGTNFQTGSIDLALGTPTPRAGIYLTASDGTVTFYDSTNAVLGTLNYTAPSSGYNFYGWEDTTNLISRVVVTDTDAQDGAITIADRVTTESVPEPAGLALLSVGASMMLRRGRARKNSPHECGG
jgi:hypothetical protein